MMTLADILITIAAFWFAAYLGTVLAVFGLPASLSESHYLWLDKFPKTGKVIFPLWMALFVALLLPSVLTVTEGTDFQIIAFGMLASLLFVAVSPYFRNGGCDSKMHFIGAYCSAAFGCVYCVIYGDWRFPAFFAVMAAGAIIYDKVRYVLYMEMVAFVGIICCLLI